MSVVLAVVIAGARFPDDTVHPRSLSEHQAILDAFAEGSLRHTRDAVLEHISSSRNHAMRVVRRYQELALNP